MMMNDLVLSGNYKKTRRKGEGKMKIGSKSVLRPCDSCQKEFLEEELEVYWQQNYLQVALSASKEKTKQLFLCEKCHKKKRRLSNTFVILALIVFVLPVILLIVQSSFY